MKRYLGLALLPFVAVLLVACATTGNNGEQAATENGQSAGQQQANMNWYGGEAYQGAPNLELTAAFLRAGDGAQDFSFGAVLVKLIGANNVNVEIANLMNRYGEEDVEDFLGGMRYLVNNGVQQLNDAGTSLPPAPAELKNVALAKALIDAGTGPDGIFWAGRMFDVLLSHDVHVQAMTDMQATFGAKVGMRTHKILNQLMYDIADALNMDDVHRAPFH